MSATRRRVTLAIAALPAALLLPAISRGQAPARLRENLEYRSIKPLPVATASRVEVIEFFWYGCPHCNNLQPSLEAWLKRKPADVEFRRIPAVFRQSWVPHARIFYTLETLGELERLHQSVYRAIHADKEAIDSTGGSAEWAAKNGVDRARWIAAFESGDVTRKVEQAVLATRAYQIEGTPSLVVDGRYITSSAMAESMPGVISNLDGLIAMAREQRAAGK